MWTDRGEQKSRNDLHIVHHGVSVHLPTSNYYRDPWPLRLFCKSDPTDIPTWWSTCNHRSLHVLSIFPFHNTSRPWSCWAWCWRSDCRNTWGNRGTYIQGRRRPIYDVLTHNMRLPTAWHPSGTSCPQTTRACIGHQWSFPKYVIHPTDLVG